jgi:type II secretory pathway pseudopilin PulG
LVVVLALVVMLSLLIVGLLLNAQSQRQLAVSQSSALDARLGAESALEIVEGQIRRATTQGIDSEGRGTFTWASQPGAVRVFDDQGNEREILKLYSSAEMIVPGGGSLAGDMPSDWAERPDEFVDLNEPVRRGGDWVYPIASPEALGTISGFASSLAKTGGPDEPDDRLVMPVRWLYVQEDGTVSADPSEGDPYLRIAFWTDDESSKINLNTASASTPESYWDMPRTASRDDRDLYAWRQPVENEFNRYPGHPATVSLRTVFPDASVRELIEASPRYEWGGSENGTVNVGVSAALPNAKQNRLYATPDEYFYNPQRGSQPFVLDAPSLDKRRFFLTTSSRTSDLNLFGQPRVTIWPISGIDDNQHRTIYDRTIAFNSTIGFGALGKAYYFLRSNPNSQTYDWDNFPRNQELFAYLRDLTGRNIPGFGGSFEDKYDGDVAGERDQILTEIFDYIRTVNLNETFGARGGGSFVSYTKEGVGNSATAASFRNASGSGWVLPIKTPFGRGAGRVPVLSELGIWFIQMQDVVNGNEYQDPDPPEVQPGLILETFSPMQGVLPWVPFNFSYRVRNIVPPQINGQNVFPDDETESSYFPPSSSYARSRSFGGTDGFAWLMSSGLSSGLPNHLGANPFLRSKPNAIKLPAGATSFTMTEGEIEIDFMTSPNSGTKGGGQVFQTYRIRIPSVTLPVPQPVKPDDHETYQATVRNGWHQRKGSSTSPPVFFAEDVVCGLAVRHGDFRTMAYLENVPPGFFRDSFSAPHGFRTDRFTAYPGAKNGSYVRGLGYAAVESSSEPFNTPRPKIAEEIDGLIEAGWDADFDNGMANTVDGPYLNKSDEGALPVGGASTHPYFYERANLAEGLFSPLRQVPSAVVFGSLPTGVKHAEAGRETFWRTLNFCPNPLSGSSHYGLSDPPDHLLLDLFTMPIVEPYAISEPFSTAGRVNLNRKLAPFTHITRDTALHAVLASQKIVAIADSLVNTYKTATNYPIFQTRFAVDAAETLKAMDAYLASKGQNLFRSASEICGVYLVPEGRTAANVASWWNDYRLTGNNSRERPYATLYPLLTTRSNVFTTHVRAQSIKRLPSGKIAVKGEFRGSLLFERYLDPNDPIFKEGTVDPDMESLEPYFRFRTLSVKQFDL